MGGDDVHAARPKNARIADGEKLAVGRVKGEFVEDAVAAFPGLGVRAGSQAVNGAPVVEGENVRADFFFAVKEALAQLSAGNVEEAGPAGAIGGEELGLEIHRGC